MQKRHPDKYHSGGLWTNSCCSHPHHLEHILTAAYRRLEQELGITDSKLNHIGRIRYKLDLENCYEHEIDHLFIGAYNSNQIQFNTEEVTATQWIEHGLLLQQVQAHPEEYTRWFPEVLAYCHPYLTNVLHKQGALV